MSLKPKPRENICWRISTEDSMPWRVVLGWDGHSNYGWSLNTGPVSWSRVCGSEEDALKATRELLQITGQIDKRLVRIAGDVITMENEIRPPTTRTSEEIAQEIVRENREGWGHDPDKWDVREERRAELEKLIAIAFTTATDEVWKAAIAKVREYAEFHLSQMKYMEQAGQSDIAASHATRSVAGDEIVAALEAARKE